METLPSAEKYMLKNKSPTLGTWANHSCPLCLSLLIPQLLHRSAIGVEVLGPVLLEGIEEDLREEGWEEMNIKTGLFSCPHDL